MNFKSRNLEILMVFPENSFATTSLAKQHFSKNFGHFRYRNSFSFSDLDSFLKFLAFSENCSWVNLVLIPKQMAENKRKELLFVFSLQKLSKLVDPAEDYSQIMARFEASETSTKSEEIKVF